MNRTLYSILLYILSPLLVLYLLFRAFKSQDYRGRWGERFGLSRLRQTDLLIHSVSMGETLAAIPLIRRIQQAYPELKITVTTTSPTGSAEVIKALGAGVQHCYLPLDFPICVKRFLKQVRPKYCVIMETELWPNLVHFASESGTKILLANARLSQKSTLAYRKRARLTQPILERLDAIAAQSEQTARRFASLGIDTEKVHVCGSLKFDLCIDSDRVQVAKILRQSWRADGASIWVAGSVHPGEFKAIIDAHRHLLRSYPDALLIMVPRHPEQFDAAAKLIASAGLNMVRRSSGETVTEATQVLLGDTMGELLTFYGAADLAFVGGTLIESGGHNPLEPAAFGLPVFLGPHYWDFTEITNLLVDSGALRIVNSSLQLGDALKAYVEDKPGYRHASQAASAVVAQNRGALERQFEIVKQML